jgi:hypothetical protein
MRDKKGTLKQEMKMYSAAGKGKIFPIGTKVILQQAELSDKDNLLLSTQDAITYSKIVSKENVSSVFKKL